MLGVNKDHVEKPDAEPEVPTGAGDTVLKIGKSVPLATLLPLAKCVPYLWRSS